MATILIVDDLPSNREVLTALLRQHGHRVVEAADGAAGLAVVLTEYPDLVITDVLMPVMDGYEFVHKLRLDPTTNRIPVVFYTAPFGAREARARALTLGVSYVLTKPAAADAVLQIVSRALAGQSESAPPDATLPAAQTDREHLRLLTDKLSEKAGDLRSANARLRALINIGLELASERDTERLLHRVCVAARDLFGASYVTLGIVDLKDGTVQRFATCGVDDVRWIKAGEPVTGMLGKVLAEQRPLRGDNPSGDPVQLELPPLHPKVQTFLAAPVASPAHVYGWFCLVGNEGRAFTEDDEDLVMALSGQIGRIYENTYFYDIAQQRAEELEREMLERLKVESALRAAEERMRFALQSANVGIWDQDFTTGLLQWSETLEAQYGLHPGSFRGTFEAFVEHVHPDDRKSVTETIAGAMKSGADFSTQHRSVCPDGSVRWLNGAGRIRLGEHGEPVRGLGISLDVTERHGLEEQVRQAQKMEAIGQLAGGVAHDFNNLLTVILGYCEMALSDLAPDAQDYGTFTEIQKAGESAAALTRQLLAFSRKEIIEPKLLDVNAVVTDMQAMLDRLIREDVRVVLALRPDVGPVTADRGQVEQIVLNLAVNARDAMPKGGVMTIETANVELDEYYARTHVAVTPGPYVALTVTDSGAGMTPDVQARLFEPFFTTKVLGKGTGLGMATVQSIVARIGGSISVSSQIGKGTTLSVYLPRADAAIPVVDAVPHGPPKQRGGSQTVLMVEDDAGLRDLTRRLLQRMGYTVLVAADADEAIRIFERHPAIDVLLTDVVLPGGSGPDLGKRIVALRPDLRVIYMSGYTEDTIVRHGVVNPEVAFLHKPFTGESLGRKLREVLDRPAPANPTSASPIAATPA